MSKELTISIPIGDWHAEALRAEMLPTAPVDVIKALRAGLPTAQIARSAIVSQEMGVTKERITRPNKCLLQAAATADIAMLARRQTHTVTLEDGRKYQAPDFVGVVRADEPEPADGEHAFLLDVPAEPSAPPEPIAYVNFDAPEALARAEMYLRDVIPGHVWKRLLTIHEHGGDVQASIGALKQSLDELAGRLL